MRRKHVVIIGLGMIAVLSLGTVGLAEDGRAAFHKRPSSFTAWPEPQTFIINGNNLQASYEGGDRNDLTLAVMP